jgi:hypothetical protein
MPGDASSGVLPLPHARRHIRSQIPCLLRTLLSSRPHDASTRCSGCCSLGCAAAASRSFVRPHQGLERNTRARSKLQGQHRDAVRTSTLKPACGRRVIAAGQRQCQRTPSQVGCARSRMASGHDVRRLDSVPLQLCSKRSSPHSRLSAERARLSCPDGQPSGWEPDQSEVRMPQMDRATTEWHTEVGDDEMSSWCGACSVLTSRV